MTERICRLEVFSKFSLGETSGIVQTNSVLTTTDSAQLLVQVTNVFNFTTTETITINVIDTGGYVESELPSFNDYSPWYPPMESAPTFCEPIYPDFESPEDVTFIYPAIIEPSMYVPLVLVTITPDIIPPSLVCDCYGV